MSEETVSQIPAQEPSAEEPSAPDPTEQLATLNEELTALRATLAERDSEILRLQREAAERTELARLFPDADPDSLPREVLEAHSQGIPLAAALALYEKQQATLSERCRAVNHRNAALSPGRAGQDAAAEYFSPDEVRRMSQSEVRKHFRVIRESMKQWN